MSEVGDACQVVMISGRMIMTSATLSLRLALLLMKIFNTIYLGKWKGSTSLQRFRAIKGENYEFINICSEDPEKLLAIEKEMEAHNLLFARLPDLCGGDGNTQYVIAQSDLNIFAAFLMDHTHGSLRDVKVGPIKESDYARTAVHPETGEYTEEFKDLNRSAQEEYRKILQLQDQSVKVEVKQLPLFSSQNRGKEQEEKDTGYVTEKSEKEKRKRTSRKEPEKELSGQGQLDFRNRDTVPAGDEMEKRFLPDKTQEKLCITQYGIRKELSPAELLLQPQLLMREEQILHKGTMTFLYDPPVRETEKWAMFPIQDGDHMVVVPRQDMLEGNTYRQQTHLAVPVEKPPRAMLYTNRDYVVVDLRNGSSRIYRGKDLLEGLTMLPMIAMHRETMENLAKNVEKNIGPGAVIPPVTKTRGGR